MNRPSLTIPNEKPSEFEFDVSIQGVPANEANVRFVIEGSAYDTTINCVRNANDRWMAKIPSMRLDETAKNFRVEVIAGGYYFCPSQGTVKIISSPRVAVAEMVQRMETEKTVKVSANVTPILLEQPKSLIMTESMTASAREALYNRCQAAGKIFARASNLVLERRLNSSALVEILEAVKKAIKLVEVKVYL